jgi:hypothetical protein
MNEKGARASVPLFFAENLAANYALAVAAIALG